MGENLGGFCDDASVYVNYSSLSVVEFCADVFEENEAGDIFPAWIAVGVVAADVTLADSSEEGVGDGMDEYVGIGVTIRPGVVWDENAAKDARATGLEGMNVVADASMNHTLFSRLLERRGNEIL